MMLKFFFWILLLANAALFAYQQGALDALLPSGREPARIANQLNADKIRLIPPPAPRREPEPAPVPAAPQPEVAPAVEPGASPVEKKPVEKKTVLACIEIGNFNPDEAKRFSAQLAALSVGGRVSQRPIMEVTSYMVYIPPQADREGAENKAEQLRALGVQDFFIIQDNSPLRWGISLGVFKHEAAAHAHLESLSQKGVRSARVGERATSANLVAFQLRGIDAESKGALDKVKAGFPKQGARSCQPA